MWGSVLFGLVGGVCMFDPAISWDTIRTLCLYERGVGGGEGPKVNNIYNDLT